MSTVRVYLDLYTTTTPEIASALGWILARASHGGTDELLLNMLVDWVCRKTTGPTQGRAVQCAAALTDCRRGEPWISS